MKNRYEYIVNSMVWYLKINISELINFACCLLYNKSSHYFDKSKTGSFKRILLLFSKHGSEKNGHIPNGTLVNGIHNVHSSKSHHRKSVEKCKDHDHHDHKHIDKQQKINYSHTNGSAGVSTTDEAVSSQESEHKQTKNNRKEKKEQDKERETVEYIQRLESDLKKFRGDLQSSRASEQELRIQVGIILLETSTPRHVFRSSWGDDRNTFREFDDWDFN